LAESDVPVLVDERRDLGPGAQGMVIVPCVFWGVVIGLTFATAAEQPFLCSRAMMVIKVVDARCLGLWRQGESSVCSATDALNRVAPMERRETESRLALVPLRRPIYDA
jgi:hypothetical protein